MLRTTCKVNYMGFMFANRPAITENQLDLEIVQHRNALVLMEAVQYRCRGGAAMQRVCQVNVCWRDRELINALHRVVLLFGRRPGDDDKDASTPLEGEQRTRLAPVDLTQKSASHCACLRIARASALMRRHELLDVSPSLLFRGLVQRLGHALV